MQRVSYNLDKRWFYTVLWKQETKVSINRIAFEKKDYSKIEAKNHPDFILSKNEEN